jgi:hypothetical protein
MRAAYDFSNGVRGKYAKRFAEGTNLVLLAPDVASEFPAATSVNRALRALIKSRSKRRNLQRPNSRGLSVGRLLNAT